MSPIGLYSENRVPESCVVSLVPLAPHFRLTNEILVLDHSYGEMGETPSLQGGRELYPFLSGGRKLYSQEVKERV